MSWLPRTTFSQITLSLILLLLINFVIFILFLREFVVDPGAIQFATMLNNQLQLLEPQLQNLTPPQAQLWLQQNVASLHYEIRPQNTGFSSLPTLRFYQILQQTLETYYPYPLEIQLSHEGIQSTLWFQLKWTQNYWLGIPFHSYLQNIYSMISMVLTLTTLVSMLMAYLITRYLLRPLNELGELAQSLSKIDQALPQISHKGPKEIQQIVCLIEQAAREMRKLVQDRELLMAGVSHDLRTPLARLRIAVEWMPEKALRNEMISDIEEMDAIIGDFLYFMRAGQNETEETIDLPVFLKSLVLDFQRQGCCITLKENTMSQLNCRPVAMKRLLTNLLHNAFKHGAPPVSLHSYQYQGELQIWVKDRGTESILPENFHQLFEPFSQGNKARTQGGSGLGLSIAKRIAHTHHARLTLENRHHGGIKAGIIFSLKR